MILPITTEVSVFILDFRSDGHPFSEEPKTFKIFSVNISENHSEMYIYTENFSDITAQYFIEISLKK